ncbi:3-oxoacyl-[acyl-carrier protein] reductase [Buchnera aphidicola str. Bp (Baizongia pistaciae)]|uniref:3-oxoacyl-[acyl-carrier-protein] reductase FabG n=1 Tax=Buchnera aphidicola subsp. Baizongia pistaciae (strain Bp) TaxID=224915 RepID=FABG_BUCBP|nr:beta-ketoacyl-ACP reductase [Buchnera aphidicola]Q89AG9.1 RecName: Full=3-oxoacyl-[acyl-carrier-protein] reductase FabG; AltName: Full=3-ketoacyl-acyl carrier protein reductase; AltName: Full=Beta-Ketoacyl-acyl carrier protein reductase; AltName: Full=Beta-ketoacyl-ACP reductase [Buchnera aphidicola str. Bp (Baizongia pistaciae)]AAO27043.1 3-oxoacyl-[acyl-carrier protein] reductase [Buchnera aphidicola str. Bp (Baizongia pistaciae)]
MKTTKKIAVITGANRGLGKGIAEELSNTNNITVIGTSTSQKGCKIINKYLKNNGIGIKLDITNPNEITKTMDFVYKNFGRVDILINNAGIIRDKLLINMKTQDWNSVLNVNLNSIFYMSKSVIRNMIKNKQGKIITIGSVIAHIGNCGQTNYSAAKLGLVGFHKSLALELAPKGITVNMIAPGLIKTGMTNNLSQKQLSKYLSKIPMKRLGTIKEISKITLFLISNDANYITGQVIHVNGGMYMP